MPFTLLAYTQSVTNGSTLTSIASITDQHVRTNGNGYIVPSYHKIALAYGRGANLSRAQIQSPKLRSVFMMEVKPVAAAAAAAQAQEPIMDIRDNPVELEPGEEVDCQVINGGAGAEQEWIGLFLSDGNMAATKGDIRTVRATGTTTLTANAWTLVPLTFDQTLIAGNYAVVGARAQAAGLVLFRFSFVGYAWRPGGVGSQNVGSNAPKGQRHGGWGEWGRFQNVQPPAIECLSSSADTSETFELDLIYMGK